MVSHTMRLWRLMAASHPEACLGATSTDTVDRNVDSLSN